MYVVTTYIHMHILIPHSEPRTNVLSNKFCANSVLFLTLKEQFLITTDEVEERVDTVGYFEESELSSSEEEETDPRVQPQVREIP